MNFFDRFRKNTQQLGIKIPGVPFKVGDRARDIYMNGYTIIEIDPEADHGLGIIRARRDDGIEIAYALIAHGFSPVSEGDKLNQTPGRITVERRRPDESSAGAYLRLKNIILHGICITNIGGLTCAPHKSLTVTVSDEILGNTILTVLAEAKNAAIPSDLKTELQKISEAAGVRSWSTFRQKASYCCVCFTPKEISILPSKYERGAFLFLGKDADIHISSISTPEQVGRALREGFSRCT